MEEPTSKSDRSVLDWLGVRQTPNWMVAKPLGRLIGAMLTVSIPLLFFAAMAAAGFVLWGTIRDIGTGAATGPNLGAGALIAALLGAPFVIWGTYLRQQSVEFQKEGLITDRINKAVEMLGAEKTVRRRVRGIEGDDLFECGTDGNPDPAKPAFTEETVPNIEVRIGGLLSLERIAQDSVRYDQGRDHVRVMEVLCAYVRENAPASEAQDHDLSEWEPLKDDAAEAERAAHLEQRKERFGDFFFESKAWIWAQELPAPREDISLAIRIIGRRTQAQREVEAVWQDAKGPWPFDIAKPDWPEPNKDEPLGKEQLNAAIAALEGWSRKLTSYAGYRPDLRKTNLQGVDMSGLVLSGSKLTGARMEGADLSRARMEGAYLRGARMEGASLGEARMEGAYLSEARMEGAYLSDARMEGAYLSGARMEGAYLRGARMEGAYLRGARMEGAYLSDARMDNTTSLSAAAFQGAALKDVDWSEVALSRTQIDAMFGDASVKLSIPDADRPAHWPIWKLPLGGEPNFYSEWQKWLSNPTAYSPPPPP